MFRVTCVQFVPNEPLFWSAGKDGLLKQWDAVKFYRIQVLELHFAAIWSISQTASGNFLVSWPAKCALKSSKPLFPPS